MKETSPLLTTPRLRIDLLTDSDAPFLFALMNSRPWLTFIGDRGIRCEQDALRFLQSGYLTSYEDRGFGYYRVSLLDGVSIGLCGFLQKAYLENIDFGFAMLPEYQRNGFALESSLAVLDYGKRVVKINKLDAVTMTSNFAAQALLKKLGFHFRRHFSLPDVPAKLMLYRLNLQHYKT